MELPRMRPYLPSRRFVSLVVALAASLALILGALSLAGRAAPATSRGLTGDEILKAIEISTGKDSDGDGLMDWEEALWGTGRAVADSDADGTGDGEEVRSGRNPLLFGPDDALSAAKNATTTGQDSTVAKSSAWSAKSALLAREAFATVIALKEGGALTPETLDDVSSSLVRAFTEEASAYPVYHLDRLSTHGDNSKEALIRYGNAVAEILTQSAANSQGNELVPVMKAMETGDGASLSDTEEAARLYEGAAEALAAVSVPSEATEMHLVLLNVFAKISQSLFNMARIVDDPLTGIVGFGQYKSASDELPDIAERYKTFFVVRRVVFGANDAGRLFSSSAEKSSAQ